MVVSAQKVFQELKDGKIQPLYLIVGEEPFQTKEITDRLKAFFIKTGENASSDFNFERFDGQGLQANELVASLDTLPGLFSEEGDRRVILCTELDKAPESSLTELTNYLSRPAETTCFVMTAVKAKKNKAWYKAIDANGYVIEVAEPHDRDWPKWQGYFEKKIGKRISPEAWNALVEFGDRKLSALWNELDKVATYVGEAQVIELGAVQACCTNLSAENVFKFAEDVLSRKKISALKRYYQLLDDGENEIKILSLLIRQFRLIWQALSLKAQGMDDAKAIASEVGAHPFFVNNILRQSKGHSAKTIEEALSQLAECDYAIKNGRGNLFDNFLIPYFRSNAAVKSVRFAN